MSEPQTESSVITSLRPIAYETLKSEGSDGTVGAGFDDREGQPQTQT